MGSRTLAPLFILVLLLSATPGDPAPAAQMVATCEALLPTADCSSLALLQLQGSISFEDTLSAATDFGNICHHRPAALVFPASVDDISRVLRAAANSSNLTVAAKGNGHSINGQAQALNGVVIDMSTLKGNIEMGKIGEVPYADVRGGELWVDLLRATLRYGLAPRSWTDYLYLTVGGTLQNAGIGGQTFRYGPQISNVLQLEVVTGKGDVRTCSPTSDSELFFASLGGLGQFGIITKARIILEPAPQKVKWIRVLYSDFKAFIHDQELLISHPLGNSFDYVEGFVVSNSNDPVNGWNQVPLKPDGLLDTSLIPSAAGPVLYCLELAKTFNAEDAATIDQKVATMLANLSFIQGMRFSIDASYFDFLNRVHASEITLRSLGVWQAPHPWLCLFVPRSSIEAFDAIIFKQKLKNGVGGPLLLYPMHKNKWDTRFSAVTPNEDIFYMVALLRSISPKGPQVESLVAENDEVLRLCRTAGLHVKQYFPHFTRQSDWEEYFDSKWSQFRSMKSEYDPQAILAPGQGIFTRIKS